MPATRKTAETSSARSTAQPPPASRARSRAAKPSKAAAVPPAIAEERRRIVEVLKPVVEMMGRMLGPNTELVLHDLTQPDASVVAIANGHVSGRKVGSTILSGPKDDRAFGAAWSAATDLSGSGHSVVNVYPTLTGTGTPLKSATVIYRDADGTPFAALCMNADLTVFKLAHAWLEHAIQGAPTPAATPESREESPDMDLLMGEIIRSAIRTFGKPVQLMNKEEKVHAVEEMLRRGLFIVKGSVGRAAAALDMSRFSIYNYLDEIRKREGFTK
ncbi:PAS domain-containing protein [Variovorax sp.]|uniref:helix-turn-helix transcriptional regulator n=1 Tax=Variovorax sp. TaxID=1871043 RepID=UPI00138144BC|nr:PAS domain-containing protein [Variovorax sp.]KAF1057331.1 MAG: Transcriptional regulator DauR [Variovorax sp.]